MQLYIPPEILPMPEIMKIRIIPFSLFLSSVMLFFSCNALAASVVDRLPGLEKLNSTEIIEAFSGKTSMCVKARDQSTCVTYMGDDGQVKRLTHNDNIRKTGKWHAAGHQLCITWTGKTRALCFDIYRDESGDFLLIRKGKLKATVKEFRDGDQSGF